MNYISISNRLCFSRNNKIILITLFLIVFSLSITAQKKYYISNNGKDTNNGTSELTPWATLDKVNSEMNNFVPGDVIAFKRGDSFTTSTSLTINVSGTSSNNIVFTSYGSGALPTINKTSIADSKNYIWSITTGSEYITVDGLKFLVKNSSESFTAIVIYADNITVKNCEFTGAGPDVLHNSKRAKGLSIWCGRDLNNIFVEDCKFYTMNDGIHCDGDFIATGHISRCTFEDIYSYQWKEAESIRFAVRNTDRDFNYEFKIDSNYFTRWGEDAIDLTGAQKLLLEYNKFENPIDYDFVNPDGVSGGSGSKAGDDGSYGTIWRFNIFKNLYKPVNGNEDASGLYMAKSDGMWIYSNLFINCEYGITSSPHTPKYSSESFHFYYNTIVKNRKQGIARWGGNGTSNNTLHDSKNNIIYTNQYESMKGDISEDYNIFNHDPKFTKGTHDILETDTNVVFVDYHNEDFRLKIGSPAINAAVTVGNSPDGFNIDAWALDPNGLKKVARDANPDIGAFEFISNKTVTYDKPVIISQPTDVTVTENETVHFSVNASCDDGIEYSWYRYPWNNETSRIKDSEINYSGAETNMLTIKNVDSASFNGQEYFCGVYNKKDRSAWVNTIIVKLTVTSSNTLSSNFKTPTITQQPTNINAKSGDNITLSVTASCNETIGYQWWKTPFVSVEESKIVNGTKYSGATTNTLTIKNIDSSDNGTKYICEVYNTQDHNNHWINSEAATILVTKKQTLISNSQSNIKVFLEGAFQGNKMKTTLLNSGYLPINQPFNIPPYNFAVFQKVNAFPNTIVDWVLIELRSGLKTKAKRFAALLNDDGHVLNIDGSNNFSNQNIPDGNYYLVIYHRNHLPIMSSSKISIKNSIINYDFTTDINKAYGKNALIKLPNGIFAMYAGDGDKNKEINEADYTIIKNNIFSTGYKDGDIDMNGVVNILDYSNINKNTSIKSNVP